jgi:hypothetical protein
VPQRALARRWDLGRARSSFRGGNKAFWWRWSRTNEVTEIVPGRAIAWITVPTWRFVDSTEWRITVTPTPGGTHIEQTYHVRRCPRWWECVVVRAIPSHRDRTASLTADLHRIGDVAATPPRVAHLPPSDSNFEAAAARTADIAHLIARPRCHPAKRIVVFAHGHGSIRARNSQALPPQQHPATTLRPQTGGEVRHSAGQ